MTNGQIPILSNITKCKQSPPGIPTANMLILMLDCHSTQTDNLKNTQSSQYVTVEEVQPEACRHLTVLRGWCRVRGAYLKRIILRNRWGNSRQAAT